MGAVDGSAQIHSLVSLEDFRQHQGKNITLAYAKISGILQRMEKGMIMEILVTKECKGRMWDTKSQPETGYRCESPWHRCSAAAFVKREQQSRRGAASLLTMWLHSPSALGLFVIMPVNMHWKQRLECLSRKYIWKWPNAPCSTWEKHLKTEIHH